MDAKAAIVFVVAILAAASRRLKARIAVIGALSGAAVVETVFGVPGLGQLIVNSIGRRDYEVIQAVVLLVAVINVLINLLTDLLYGLIDPRIRVS